MQAFSEAEMASHTRNATRRPEYEVQREKNVLEVQRRNIEELQKKKDALGISTLAHEFNSACEPKRKNTKVS